jgi:hypothetical protein
LPVEHGSLSFEASYTGTDKVKHRDEMSPYETWNATKTLMRGLRSVFVWRVHGRYLIQCRRLKW